MTSRGPHLALDGLHLASGGLHLASGASTCPRGASTWPGQASTSLRGPLGSTRVRLGRRGPPLGQVGPALDLHMALKGIHLPLGDSTWPQGPPFCTWEPHLASEGLQPDQPGQPDGAPRRRADCAGGGGRPLRLARRPRGCRLALRVRRHPLQPHAGRPEDLRRASAAAVHGRPGGGPDQGLHCRGAGPQLEEGTHRPSWTVPSCWTPVLSWTPPSPAEESRGSGAPILLR